MERILERVKGIEPSYSAWEAAALPLSYTRIFIAFSYAPRKSLVPETRAEEARNGAVPTVIRLAIERLSGEAR